MDNPFAILETLVKTLKGGGPYAGWGLFVLMWYYERRENKKSKNDFFDAMSSKIRNDVQQVNSINALAKSIERIKSKIKNVNNVVAESEKELKKVIEERCSKKGKNDVA